MKDVNMCIILFIYILGVFCLDFTYCYIVLLLCHFKELFATFVRSRDINSIIVGLFVPLINLGSVSIEKKVGREVTDCFYLRQKEAHSIGKKVFKPNDTVFPRNKVYIICLIAN